MISHFTMYLLEKASNSVVMFFAGAVTTLVIVLFSFVIILIHKRCMQTPKKSNSLPAVERVEMENESLPEPEAAESQNNQVYACI